MAEFDAEAIAQRFHEAYERLAPSFGYETREASAVPWDQVPENNRRLMIAVVAEVAPLIAQHETNRALVANRNARDHHQALKQAVMERDWLLAEATDDVRARYHAARQAEQEADRG